MVLLLHKQAVCTVACEVTLLLYGVLHLANVPADAQLQSSIAPMMHSRAIMLFGNKKTSSWVLGLQAVPNWFGRLARRREINAASCL